ncbi:PepSY domain-containing protein [Shewanella oncorhynchi]|uniref:PepSY domain-containing protein n=1 Tax=Shewanella oncorhynchi TaxID=2726434 RepID=UPI003D7A8545
MMPNLKLKPKPKPQSKHFKRWVKIAHYWLGAIVSIQLLLWLVTGVYFNLTPHDELKGMEYQLSHSPEPQRQEFDPQKLVDIAPLLAKHTQVESLTLIALAGKPVYVLDAKVQRYAHQSQQQTLIDAYTGNTLLINKQSAQQLALESYTGPGKITQVKQISPPISEWPTQCNSLWQIAIDDDLSTRIYINAVNGELVGHKNDHTDIADLMFKLHFMDYLNQGSFNNPFSWLLGILTLLLSLSGLYWIIENLVLKRYRLSLS